MGRRRGLAALAAAAAFTLGGGLVSAIPAAAEPSTTVRYAPGATSTKLRGKAFDTCTAPSLAKMRAWKSNSPYTGVGVYIGGPNRGCAQPELTVNWVAEVSKMRWRIIPIYMGRQAPGWCSTRPNAVKITADEATSQGTASADDAIAKAQAIGLRSGSAIYGDMEHYDATNTWCRTIVLRYLSAWTKRLHSKGYLSGVYAHLYSGAKHLSEVYNSTSYARPDALWIARWDQVESLKGWQDIPDTQWASSQRAKQYRGDHNETWGGVTLNIDNDLFDAPVATVSHPYKVTSTGSLSARSGPSTSYPVKRTIPSGSTVYLRCQLPGSKVGTTSVWDKLNDGLYVTDYYVSTPSKTTYSAPLQKCLYPYQVKSSTPLVKRSGPGTSYASKGSLQRGALARVLCQRSGSTVGTTKVWDKLDDGTYVTDYYVATPNNTTYSAPIPRC